MCLTSLEVVRVSQYQQIALQTMNGTIGFGAYSEVNQNFEVMKSIMLMFVNRESLMIFTIHSGAQCIMSLLSH